MDDGVRQLRIFDAGQVEHDQFCSRAHLLDPARDPGSLSLRNTMAENHDLKFMLINQPHDFAERGGADDLIGCSFQALLTPLHQISQIIYQKNLLHLLHLFLAAIWKWLEGMKQLTAHGKAYQSGTADYGRFPVVMASGKN